MSCSSESPNLPRESLSEQQQQLSLVANSKECAREQIGPNRCIHVPPISSGERSPPSRWQLDGILDSKEWAGTVTVPYVNQSLFSQGKIHLAIVNGQPSLSPALPPARQLRVYLEDIPIDSRLPQGLVRIYLDHDRFETENIGFGLNDRLLLNPPTVDNSLCRTIVHSDAAGLDYEVPNACPPPPSGSHFVDIFNTHLQANNPAFCENLAWKLGIDTALALIPGGAPLAAVKELLQADMNCYRDVADVRKEQLEQMNSFLRDMTSETPDRPVLIAGDLNLDGKLLDDGEYNTLIDTLRIGPVQASNKTSPRDDSLTPWPAAYDWDLDHGDIVRNRKNYDEKRDLTGTYITGGSDDEEELAQQIQGATVIGQDWMGNFKGNERFDFLLARPPFAPDEANFKSASWLLGTNPDDQANLSQDDVWVSPWPGAEGDFGAPPKRISDHKPVIANLTLIPMNFPASYHPTWKHSWELRAVSANGTGMDDCYDEADLYPQFKDWGRLIKDELGNQSLVASSPSTITGQVCEDNNSASWPADGCTSNWYLAAGQQPETDIAHIGGAKLYDSDTGLCGSDELIQVLDSGDTPYINTFWNLGGLGVFQFVQFPSLEPWGANWIRFDNEPVELCSRSATPHICLRTSTPELPPNEQ